jgi:Flp pilus assembly protein TadD
MNVNLGVAFGASGQNDQAIEQFKKTVELAPDNPAVRGDLALTYLENSQYKEGIAQINEGLRVSPGDPRFLALLAYAYAREGRKSDAQQLLEKLTSLPKQEYLPPQDIALVYVGFGDKDKAFEWLEKAYDERDLTSIKGFKLLDPLRSDPRYQDLLRRMNLTP